MTSLPERTSVLETKVENIENKLDELKTDIKENNQEIKQQLKTMYDACCTQHAELGKKLTDLEKFKYTWVGGGAALLMLITVLANLGHIIDLIKVIKN
jgi:chromosome segregation ATPase